MMVRLRVQFKWVVGPQACSMMKRLVDAILVLIPGTVSADLCVWRKVRQRGLRKRREPTLKKVQAMSSE